VSWQGSLREDGAGFQPWLYFRFVSWDVAQGCDEDAPMALWCRAKGPVDSSLGHRPRNQGPLNCRGLKVRSGMACVRAAFTCPASKRGRSRPRVRRRFCDGVRCARFGRRQGARREHIRQWALRAAIGGGPEPPNCRLQIAGAARCRGALAAAKTSCGRTPRTFQTRPKCWAGGA
jgi:hypothetical protein